MEKDIRDVRSAIENLAITSRSSRVTIGDVVLSATLLEDQRHGAITGTEDRVLEIGSNGVEFRAAEKDGEGMVRRVWIGL